MLLAAKLVGIEDVDEVPQDIPSTKGYLLSWKWDVARKIVDLLWLEFPETEVESVVKASEAFHYDSTLEADIDLEETVECAQCFYGMSRII